MRSLAVALVAVAVLGTSGVARASGPNPRKAAKGLIARMHFERLRARYCNVGATKVSMRHGRLWLAVAVTCPVKHEQGPTRVRIFRWTGAKWRQDGVVVGALSGGQWPTAAFLTNSRAPEFAISGCGAGGIVCTSIVSKASGQWRAVPFEYGYGTSLVVNGGPEGRLMLTHAASYEPAAETYLRYSHGVFVPADPPGKRPRCSTTLLERAINPASYRTVRFTQATCADGWAVAVGDEPGLIGPAVGLFEWDHYKRRWTAHTVDSGNLLPAAPATYHLPVSLLERLLAGPVLAPQLAASKLIAGLYASHGGFYWGDRNGIVEAGGARWLIAIVPTGPGTDTAPGPIAAEIFRWDGSQWATAGTIPSVPQDLNVAYDGGWFVGVPQADGSVAFRLVAACCNGPDMNDSESRRLITNAGGGWHVTG